MKLNIIFFILVLLSFGSCSDEQEAFILRDKADMEFTYENSTKTFTVRSDGKWELFPENEWIKVDPASGTGDGTTYHNINVTVSRNPGKDRSGKIAIHAAGKKVYVNVFQKIGPVISFGAPSIRGVLQQNMSAEYAVLTIPYSGAIGDEQFTISASPSGQGSAGITAVDKYPVLLSAKSGIIEIPLSGKPSASGPVIFDMTTSYSDYHPDVVLSSIEAMVYPPLNITMGEPALSQASLIATKREQNLTLNIPYSNAEIGLSFNLSVNITGISGLKDVIDFPVVINSANGVISIPISGAPYSVGNAVFNVIYPGLPLQPLSIPVISDGKRYYPGTILVTGVMIDPKGNDSSGADELGSSVAWYNPSVNSLNWGGGNEYIQLMATEDIDFSETPCSVIVCRNKNSENPTANGWIEGGNRTYKFNLTSGTVARGEFFYVGGTGKALNGCTTNQNDVTASASFDGTDPGGHLWKAYPIILPSWSPDASFAGVEQKLGVISFANAKWCRAKAYRYEAGDDGIGSPIAADNPGLLSNSPNPNAFPGTYGVDGIAVYEGISITESTTPMDVVFFGYDAGGAKSFTENTGYTIPVNDLYSPVNMETGKAQPYFGQGSNTAFFESGAPATNFASPCATNSGTSTGRDCSNFVKFAGELDTDNSWISPRQVKTLYLLEPKHYLEHYGINRQAQLSDIETNIAGANNYIGQNGGVMIVRPR